MYAYQLTTDPPSRHTVSRAASVPRMSHASQSLIFAFAQNLAHARRACEFLISLSCGAHCCRRVPFHGGPARARKNARANLAAELVMIKNKVSSSYSYGAKIAARWRFLSRRGAGAPLSEERAEVDRSGSTRTCLGPC